MAVVFKNNAKTTLASGITSSATSITVADGSVFPTLTGSDTFFCTLDDGTNIEIVEVTAISSNTLTVTRAQDNTSATSFSTGTVAELRLTAGILNLFSQTGSDINAEVEAYLDANGTTFPDSVKAQFGASNDLQIYHDGSNSYISESGTGSLILKSGGTMVLRTPADENMIHMTANGAVKLYHDNSEKLATTSTGIDVTGTVTADGLTVNSGTTNKVATFSSTDVTAFIKVSDNSTTATAHGYGVNGNDLSLYANDSERVRILSTGDVNFKTGGLRITGTEVITSARNLTNIGTITSGGITSTGNATFNSNQFKIQDASPTLILKDTSDDDDHQILFRDNNDALLFAIQTQNADTGDALTFYSVADEIVHRVGSTNRLTIDGLGIGVTGIAIVDGGVGVNSTGVLHVRQSGDGDGSGIAITSSNATSHRIWKNASGVLNIGSSSNSDAFQQDLTGNVTIEGTISSGAITASAPIKVLQPSSSAINELLVLEADDPNADIIMTDNTGSVRLRTSGNGDFKIFTGGSATSQNASGATTALTIDQSQNSTFAGTISSGAIASSASITASGNSNNFGNTTIAALSATSGTFSASITASGNSNSFGNSSFGTISSGAITSTELTITGGTDSEDIYINNTSPTLGFTDSNSFSDSNDVYLIRGASTGKLQFQFKDDSAGTTTQTFLIDQSGNTDIAGTISSGAITSSGAIAATNFNAVNNSGYGTLEVGGSSGAFIDLKKPSTDDYDVRIVTDAGTGGRVQSNGVFDIDAAGDITLDADGGDINLKDNGTSMASFTTSSATFAGTISSGNITTTGYLRGPATFTIDPATHANNTGTVVIAGNLQVDGTTTTINSTTMTVDDLNLTLASGAANAAAANGAGITVDGASATITYDGTNDEWDFNKDINVTGGITTSGNLDIANKIRHIGDTDTYLSFANADDFRIVVGNSTRAAFNTSKIHFNQEGINQDFQVESNNSTHMLFVDASTDRVGIGTSSIDEKLHIEGSVNNDDIAIKIKNTYDDNLSTSRPAAALLFQAASTNAHLRVFGAPADTAANHQIDLGSTASGSFITFSPASTEAMRINSTAVDVNVFLDLNDNYITGVNSYRNVNGTEIIDANNTSYTILKSYAGASRLWLGETATYLNNTNYYFRDTSSNHLLTLNTNGLNIRTAAGGLLIEGTEVITGSRNLTNIGTISSGAIDSLTSSADIPNSTTANLYLVDTRSLAANTGGSIVFSSYYTGTNAVSGGSYIKGYKENANDGDYGYGLKFGVRQNGQGTTGPVFTLNSSGNATFTGTISSGAITSSGNLTLNSANYIQTSSDNIVHKITGTNTTYTAIGIANTSTGDAGIFMDASNGDFSGSDYVFIGQKNNLDLEIRNNPNGGDIYLSESNVTSLRLSGGNATFYGTINSGAITSSGPITVNNVNNTYNFKAIAGDTDSWFGVYDDANNSANIIVTRSNGATSFLHLGHSGATTINGTLTSGDITSSGTVTATGGTMTGALTIDVDNVANGALRIEANQTNPDNDFYFAQEIISTLSGTTATTGDREQGGIYMDINSTATGGDTSNEHRAYGMHIDLDSTGDADLVYGVYSSAVATPTTGTTTNVYGGFFHAEDNGGAGNVGTILGVQGSAASDNSTSDTNAMYGGFFKAYNVADSATITTATAVYGELEIASGSADIYGTSYVFRAEYDNNGTVSQTNTTYLYYGNYAGVLPTNAYGVYIVDAVDNYFAGAISSGAITSSGVVTINEELSGDASQLVITNTQGATLRMGITGSGANEAAHIKTNSGEALEFHIGQAANASTPDITFLADGGGIAIQGSTVIDSSRNIFTPEIELGGDAEHKLRYSIGSMVSGGTTHTTILQGRQVDIYGYDDIQIRAGSSDKIVLTASGSAKIQIDANTNILNGVLEIGGSTFADQSRNITAGTISSGAIDSSGTSNFDSIQLTDASRLGFGTVKSGATVGHTASVDEGIFWHTSNDYGIYRTSGTWGSPNYQQLKIKWATGIEIDGNGTNYGKSGINFLNGNIKMDGTQILDASRNLTNIGTISSGAITTSGTGTAGVPTLDIINSSSNTFNHSIEAIAPNMTSGETNILVVGQASSTKNSGYIGYYYVGAGSNSNFVSIGHWGADHLFRVYGDGTVRATTGAISSYGGGYDVSGTTVIDSSRNLTNIASITTSGSIDLTGLNDTTDGADIHLPRGSHITFYGNNNNDHSIGSRNNTGAITDDLRISSYGALYIDLDSNNNNDSSADFVIGRHGSGDGTMANLFSVSGETGAVISNNNITAYGSASDVRLKENIEVIQNPIDKVQKLRGVTFNYKKDGSKSTGLIAQELEEVLPEVVYETHDLHDEEDKFKAVRYGNIVGLLVEAIKEQQKEIEYMKSEIKTLKENNNGN